jgi:uncharacterized protein YecT (DUF1311 family)
MPRLVIAAIALLALQLAAGSARAGYWCEPLRAYYPWARTCPEPWQRVDRRWEGQSLAIPPASPAAPAAPVQRAAATQGAPQGAIPGAILGDQPTFAAPAGLTRGDALDTWCKGQQSALNIAVCSDAELRALAIDRLHAFDDARARLAPDQQKVLIADQNGWAMSYPQGCGLNGDAPPTLPLAPALKNCLAQAGRERLQYLQTYRGAEAKGGPQNETQNDRKNDTKKPGPTAAAQGATLRDQPTFAAPASLTRGDALDNWCKGLQTALNIAVCSDAELRAAAIERLHAFDDAKARLAPDQQKALVADQNGWVAAYPQNCGLNGDVPPIVPLAPALKNCLAEAGRDRLQYLQSYGTAEAKGAGASPAQPAAPAAPAPPLPAPAATANPVPPAPPPPTAAKPAESQAAPQAAPAPPQAAPSPPQAAPSPPQAAPSPTEPAAPAPAAKSAAAKPAPERHGSNWDLPGLARAGAMLIAVLAVGLWLMIAVLGRRSRVRAKTVDGARPVPPRAP